MDLFLKGTKYETKVYTLFSLVTSKSRVEIRVILEAEASACRVSVFSWIRRIFNQVLDGPREASESHGHDKGRLSAILAKRVGDRSRSVCRLGVIWP